MTVPPDEQDLHAWMDGEADEETARRVERYLAQNPEAAAEVEGWRQDAGQLRLALGRHAMPMASAPEPHQIRHRARRQRQWKLATACALVLTLTLGGYTGWQLKASQLIARHQPMEDAVQAYKLFDNQRQTPMDVVASQQADLKHWVGRYFINGNPPPNLEQFGFTFLGARLMATEQGPAALVIYQDPRGTRVGWYIRPLQPVKLPHGQRQTDELMAQYWSDEHYNYALVTPLNSPQVGGVRKAMSLANS